MAAPASLTVTGGPKVAVRANGRVGVVVNLNVEFPRKLDILLGVKARYKVLYGGRGGAKSWGIARALLIRGVTEPGLRVLCTREVQSSLDDSVYQLLKDQIEALGLSKLYRCLKNEIRGPGGTKFIFKGLSDPEALKSAEGVDVCWIEEARILTEESWKKLDPTVRKAGSEIWISFNPELATDFVYKFFVKNAPPPRSLVVKISWFDNPWFDDTVLREQMEHARETNYDDYLWVWEGHCRTALAGAVYQDELRKATKEHRICRFGVVPGRPIHTFWDLGRGDLTAIWFVQIVGLEYRIIRYYSNNGKHISHYTALLEELREEHGYNYGTCWLPHDADSELLASKRTIRQQVEDAGFKVRIVPHLGAGAVTEGINAARTIFPYCWFHEVDAGDGVDALRAYHYRVKADKEGSETRSKNPVHDWSSNGADGFRYMGVALKEDSPKRKPRASSGPSVSGPRAWMAR